MVLEKLKILKSHGRQYIKSLEAASLPEIFRGRIEIRDNVTAETERRLAEMCPSGAISTAPLSVDMGRCVFCRECEFAENSPIRFTNDHRMATNCRENLIITADSQSVVAFDRGMARAEIYRIFGRALRLRSVCAGGDASTEMELNATMNVNFDFSRYGVEFVASPRHADGIVITGPITSNMETALEVCYDAVPDPKLIILAGTDAISGGLFARSRAVNRDFTEKYHPDLYVPGNPVHPLTFIDGIMKLLTLRAV